MSLVAQITTQHITTITNTTINLLFLASSSEAVVKLTSQDVVDEGARDVLTARLSGVTATILTRLRFRDAPGSRR